MEQPLTCTELQPRGGGRFKVQHEGPTNHPDSLPYKNLELSTESGAYGNSGALGVVFSACFFLVFTTSFRCLKC